VWVHVRVWVWVGNVMWVDVHALDVWACVHMYACMPVHVSVNT